MNNKNKKTEKQQKDENKKFIWLSINLIRGMILSGIFEIISILALFFAMIFIAKEEVVFTIICCIISLIASFTFKKIDKGIDKQLLFFNEKEDKND